MQKIIIIINQKVNVNAEGLVVSSCFNFYSIIEKKMVEHRTNTLKCLNFKLIEHIDSKNEIKLKHYRLY